MARVFISYHHENDQSYKEELLRINEQYRIFTDVSVDTGDIDEHLSDETIRQKIRDEYLRETTVTILLVGIETKKRKHIDWEIYSSMFDGPVNKKSGILVINLPTINSSFYTTSHDNEKTAIYPEQSSWVTCSRSEYEQRYPYMPFRIIDNLVASKSKISVVNWDKIIQNPLNLNFLVNSTHNDRLIAEYDLSRPMMRANI